MKGFLDYIIYCKKAQQPAAICIERAKPCPRERILRLSAQYALKTSMPRPYSKRKGRLSITRDEANLRPQRKRRQKYYRCFKPRIEKGEAAYVGKSCRPAFRRKPAKGRLTIQFALLVAKRLCFAPKKARPKVGLLSRQNQCASTAAP